MTLSPGNPEGERIWEHNTEKARGSTRSMCDLVRLGFRVDKEDAP